MRKLWTMSRGVSYAHKATSYRLKIFAAMALVLHLWGGLPTQIWFSVANVQVDDAIVGMAPKMDVDRVINRTFTGSWRVELERKVAGGFEFADSAQSEGQFEYDVDNVLPENLDFDWWTWPKKLRPAPGFYRIETCWALHFVLIADRQLCVKSNVFEIKGA
jgi:hypothetical protein